jgi:hypothetical protein
VVSPLNAYTWSKSLDQASAIALGGAVPNVFNLRSQWGRSDFDAHHVLAISWIWDLPKFAGAAARGGSPEVGKSMASSLPAAANR